MGMLAEVKKGRPLTTRTLARRLGYERADNPKFQRQLKRLVARGTVKVFRSGYRSEPPNHHARVVMYAGREKITLSLSPLNLRSGWGVCKVEKKTMQLNVRVPPSLLVDLEEIGEYERAGVPELVRGWIREKVAKYRDSKRFQAWKKRKAEGVRT